MDNLAYIATLLPALPERTFTVIGWLGVVFCTLAYFLLSAKLLTAESKIFQFLNMVGGLCLATVAIHTHDLPNVAVNVLWMFIGAFALSHQLRSKRLRNR